MTASHMDRKNTIYSAAAIKSMCLDAGADDVGFVDLDRESLQKEREGILHVYSLTRTVIAVIIANNRENIQSPARYVANEEFHHTGDRTSSVSRDILRRLNQLGIRGVVVNKGWPMAMDRYPGKIWDVSHKIMAVEAGLGHMGLNRLVLHPKYGSCIQLESILINGVIDEYDQSPQRKSLHQMQPMRRRLSHRGHHQRPALRFLCLPDSHL